MLGLLLSSLLLAPDSASMVWVGDAMQHQAQLSSARNASDDSYSYAHYFDSIADYIASADYAVANLETPLGGAPFTGYPAFCAPDSYAEALRDVGFDLLLCANNHILDRRDRGLHRTITTLDSLSIPHTGIYHDTHHRSQSSPMIVDVGGFKVAILNYTYGTNGFTVQGEAIVDYIDRQLMASDVAEARNLGAELVAVAVHWGEEYHLLPSRSQQSLAGYLKELGVDMIIGSHPHVVQPMELSTDSTGQRQFLIYSLGNFISAMRTVDTRGGAMVRLHLSRDQLGRPSIDEASYQLVFVYSPLNGHTDGFTLRDAQQPLSGIAEQQRRQFLANALPLFNLHNLNVAQDTLRLNQYHSPRYYLSTLKP